MKYKYIVQGTGAANDSWSVQGTITVREAGQFQELVQQAQREAFQALTQGKAEYGRPGVGCRGPYKITRFVIEEETWYM